MKAYQYTSDQPFDHRPSGMYASPNERLLAICDSLQGLLLGDYDFRTIAWLSGLDNDTCRVVVGLILRARKAGPYMPPDLGAPATPEEIAATKAEIRAIRRVAPDASADALASPEEIAAIKGREDV